MILLSFSFVILVIGVLVAFMYAGKIERDKELISDVYTIIEFVPEVPKTLSGKIRRVELRQQEVEKQESGAQSQKNEFFYWDFPELSSKKK